MAPPGICFAIRVRMGVRRSTSCSVVSKAARGPILARRGRTSRNSRRPPSRRGSTARSPRWRADVRILYLHPGSWSGEPVMLRLFRDLGHDVCVLEEKRDTARPRELRDSFQDAGDGIRTLFYDPGRGFEKALTWPVDRFFKRSF